ncbi:hypothetical protein [Anaeromyxobacter oryzae]|uniref:Uncharacterized protein n=1 Tax=Anaeromyxobacter oryzae TaxID=2918170 RepID=A0ABN6MN11_9BACT|nr:hypothetical protein [Anaeromyxobacter oryzae]BDG02345.1 hypothetical protein AMOR_13410 [Anaeromyxobacter oryzae]
MIPVLVAALLVTASATDTVYTVDGGRVAGTVVEESKTSGVTIQLPDGSVRRIEPSQVSRIEFADGTISTSGPPPAASPPVAPAPRAPAAEGPVDTVYFAAGGRVRGTVMEEDARTGVKVRLLDASIHAYPAQDLARIVYADGTVSTPTPATLRTPEPAPRAKSPEAPFDVVYFLGGGRVRGTVIEEHPRTGVRVRLMDGSVVTYARNDLVRIEYADGSVSRRKTVETAVVAQAAPPPAAPPPPIRTDMDQLLPLYLTLGVGATFLGGSADSGVSMSSIFEPAQAHLSSELALRFTPSFAFGVYGDVGAGDPASSVRDTCRVQGIDCIATTGRVGFMVRHTWSPLSRRPKWLSLGTGWEFGGVTADHRNGGGYSELFSYTGREYLRLGAGVDFRSNQVLGFGLYGSIAVGEYDRYKVPTSASVPLDGRTHTTGQVGIRLTLFP